MVLIHLYKMIIIGNGDLLNNLEMYKINKTLKDIKHLCISLIIKWIKFIIKDKDNKYYKDH